MVIEEVSHTNTEERERDQLKVELSDLMPLPLMLSVHRGLPTLHLWCGYEYQRDLKLSGYYFRGLLAAGEAAHLSEPED